MPCSRFAATLATLALALGLSGCQPAMRAGEAGAAARPGRHLVVTPPAGAPAASGPVLAGLLAASLRDLGLSAGDDAAARGHLLSGAVEEKPRQAGTALLVITWRLADPAGAPLGEFIQVREVASEAWRRGDVALLAFLAERAAPRVRRLLRGPPPAPAPAAPLSPLYVAPVDGAGDGRLPLAAAMRAALAERGAEIVRAFGDNTYLVLGAAYLDRREEGTVTVEIYWTVMAPDGEEIAVVPGKRELAPAALDGAWEALAPAFAAEAAGAIVELVRRAGPPG